MRHFSAALTAMRRSPYQTLAAILIVSITFFVGYSLALLLFSTNQLLHYFETRPQVSAFFQVSAKPEDVQALAKEMESKPYVDKVEVISKEEALKLYQTENKNDPLMMELVTADILPASIEVSAKNASDLPQIASDLQDQDGIDEVVYQKNVIEELQSWTQTLRTFGLASVSILAFTSFIMVMITIGMKVALKKRAIQIMKILGASGWYIFAPFFWEGVLYGVVSSIIGFGMVYVLVLYLTPSAQDFLNTIPLLPFSNELLLSYFGAGTGLGVLFGSFASWVAVRRMLHRTL